MILPNLEDLLSLKDGSLDNRKRFRFADCLQGLHHSVCQQASCSSSHVSSFVIDAPAIGGGAAGTFMRRRSKRTTELRALHSSSSRFMVVQGADTSSQTSGLLSCYGPAYFICSSHSRPPWPRNAPVSWVGVRPVSMREGCGDQSLFAPSLRNFFKRYPASGCGSCNLKRLHKSS